MMDQLGPWAVSGPALEVGARALNDFAWADETRKRLAKDAKRLDAIMFKAGADVVGGTDLFRLYDVGEAAVWQDRLAQGQVWSRIFPYSTSWLRLGLPASDRWDQLEAALA
jgi:cobalamin biosynthetic protein CobC